MNVLTFRINAVRINEHCSYLLEPELLKNHISDLEAQLKALQLTASKTQRGKLETVASWASPLTLHGARRTKALTWAEIMHMDHVQVLRWGSYDMEELTLVVFCFDSHSRSYFSKQHKSR